MFYIFKKYSFILSITVVSVLSGCFSSHPGKVPQTGDQFISIKDRSFIDPMGREMIFSGVNMVNKSPDGDYFCALTPKVFENLRKAGFNVIRLGIIWDGLEPEPGVFDERMFDCLDERIQWARGNGLYVLLDMHQDLYSVKFSDGAPDWATLTEDQPHYTGQVWSDSYLISPAVQTAFDNFWKNTPVKDGVGVQDHYANLWKYIAKRYANDTMIIGFDLMNEPFPGSAANNFMPAMVEAYAGMIAASGNKVPGQDELIQAWSSPESRAEILLTLQDTNLYKQIIFSTLEMNRKFEQGDLSAMYQKVTQAIREVDTNHIVFLEHSYFSNPGVPSSLLPVKDKNGKVDRKVAYSPHGYDLVVDTEAYTNASSSRVKFLFDQAEATSKRLNMPMLVGEWGAFGGKSPAFADQADGILRLFENYKCSNTYWAYSESIETYPYFQILVRSYPKAIAGKLENYSNQPGKSFSCSWEEDGSVKGSSVFFISSAFKAGKQIINISLNKKEYKLKALPDTEHALLIVPVSGKAGVRKLEINY
jgi:endoglycosylceramidase